MTGVCPHWGCINIVAMGRAITWVPLHADMAAQRMYVCTRTLTWYDPVCQNTPSVQTVHKWFSSQFNCRVCGLRLCGCHGYRNWSRATGSSSRANSTETLSRRGKNSQRFVRLICVCLGGTWSRFRAHILSNTPPHNVRIMWCVVACLWRMLSQSENDIIRSIITISGHFGANKHLWGDCNNTAAVFHRRSTD